MRGPFIVNAGSHQEDVFPCMPTFLDVKVTSEQREEYMIQVRSFFMCNITLAYSSVARYCRLRSSIILLVNCTSEVKQSPSCCRRVA